MAQSEPDENLPHHELEEIVETLEHAGVGDKISLRDVVVALGPRSFAPLLLVPATVVVSPLSGILFVSSICGLAIALISLQIVIGRSKLWLPEFLLDKSVARSRVDGVLERIKSGVHRINDVARTRWTILTRRPFIKGPALVCMILGALMPVLEIVPFSSSLLGLCVMTMALGMLLDDGMFVVCGLVFATALVLLGGGVALSIIQGVA